MNFKDEIKTILVAIISYFLSNLLNIAILLPFVPEDKKIEINLLIYTTLLTLSINKFLNYLSSKRVYIEIIAYKKGEEKILNLNPKLLCSNNMGVSEIFFSITAIGKMKKSDNLKIVINFPKWLEPQSTVIKRKDGLYEFDLAEVLEVSNSFEKTKYTKIQIFPMIATLNPEEKFKEAEVKISLEAKKSFCIFKHLKYKFRCNFFSVKVGGM